MNNVIYFSHTATSVTPVTRMKTHMTGLHSDMLDRFIHNGKGSLGNNIKFKDHAWKLEYNVEVKLHKFMETIGSKLERALLETDVMNSGNMRMTHKRDYEYAILLNSGVLENFKCPAFCAKTGSTCCAKHHVVPEDEVKQRQKVNIFKTSPFEPFFLLSCGTSFSRHSFIPSLIHRSFFCFLCFFCVFVFFSFVSFFCFFLLFLLFAFFCLLSFVCFLLFAFFCFFCLFLFYLFYFYLFFSFFLSFHLCFYLSVFLPFFLPFFSTHIYPSGHSEGPQKHGPGSAGGGGPQARSRHGPATCERGTTRAPAAGR